MVVWLDLSGADQKDYEVVKENKLAKMAPVGFVLLGDFHSRKLKPGGSLSVFLHEPKKLLSQAIPNLNTPTCDKLLLHQLLASIPPNVRCQLCATEEVDDAEKVRIAVCKAADNHRQQAAGASGHSPTGGQVVVSRESFLHWQKVSYDWCLP